MIKMLPNRYRIDVVAISNSSVRMQPTGRVGARLLVTSFFLVALSGCSAEEQEAESQGQGGDESKAPGPVDSSEAESDVGRPCVQQGDLGCSSTTKNLTLVCGQDLIWKAGEQCEGEGYCRSDPGEEFGRCVTDNPCATLEPGAAFCNGNRAVTCSADQQVERETDCESFCVEGSCDSQACFEPTQELHNCDVSCGELSEDCWEHPDAECLYFSTYPLESQSSIVLRTPEAAEGCYVCANEDTLVILATLLDGAETNREFGGNDKRLRIRTFGDWHVREDAEFCPVEGDPVVDCLILETAPSNEVRQAYVYTKLPTAGSENVLIEVVDEAATCP